MEGKVINFPSIDPSEFIINPAEIQREAEIEIVAAQDALDAARSTSQKTEARQRLLIAGIANVIFSEMIFSENGNSAEALSTDVPEKSEPATPEHTGPLSAEDFKARQQERLGDYSLAEEDWEKAYEAHAGLVNLFSSDSTKLPPEDVNIVPLSEESYFTVMLTSGSGLHKGHRKSVLEDSESFTLKLGEDMVDTRSAMTQAVYDDFVADAKRLDNPLPDSPLDGSETMLTGEEESIKPQPEKPTLEDKIPQGLAGKTTIDRQTRYTHHPSGKRNHNVKVRPLVKIKKSKAA